MTQSSFTPLPQHKSADPGTGRVVLWVVLLGVAFWPRLWIIGFWIFGRQLGDAFSGWIVPALGFLLLPWTTLLYAFMWSVNSDGVHGWEWSLVVVAFLVDVWFWAAARRSLRQ
jgi:hypothetical protein